MRSDHQPPRRRALILLLCSVALSAGGWMASMSFLSSFVAKEFDAGIWSAALIMIAVHTGSFTIGGWLSLRVVNRFGSKVSYGVGQAMLAAYLAFLGLTQNFLLAIPLGLVAGIGLALHWTGVQNYTVEIAPLRHRGLISGAVALVMVAAVGISGLVLGQIAAESGFRHFASIAAAMIVLASLISLLLLPRAAARPKLPPSGNVFAGLADPILRQMSLIRGAHAMVFVLFNLMAGPRLFDIGGGIEYVGYLTFAGSIAGGLAQLVVGRLSDLFGRTGVLYLLQIGGVLACISFPLLDNVYLLLAITSLNWFIQSAFQTILVALGGDLSPPGGSSNAMALLTVTYSFGLVIAAAFIGALSATAWPDVGFFLTGAISAAALLAVYRLRHLIARSSRVVA